MIVGNVQNKIKSGKTDQNWQCTEINLDRLHTMDYEHHQPISTIPMYV